MTDQPEEKHVKVIMRSGRELRIPYAAYVAAELELDEEERREERARERGAE